MASHSSTVAMAPMRMPAGGGASMVAADTLPAPRATRRPKATAAARVAGALSITIWTCVIFLGRWIGFTGGYEVPVPEDLDFDFSGF